MTDNDEIIKALECCSMGSYPACRDCPYHEQYNNHNCITKRNDDIKDLINRQKAEIDRLKTDNEQLKSDYICETLNFVNINKLYEAEKEKVAKAKQYIIDACKRLKTAKSEAIKEFAERLKEFLLFDRKRERTIAVVTEREIDNLVKEMVGSENCDN